MATKKEEKAAVESAVAAAQAASPTVSIEALAAALTAAIQAARPEKKTPFNRKINTPWTPKDGSPKAKLRRKMFHHGMTVDEDILSNDEINLMNEIKPGSYLANHVRVNRRKDRGIDIDYPIKTAAQRLKLVNQFGVRNLKELLELIVAEGKRPKAERMSDDD